MSEYTPETLRTDAEKKAIPYFARLRMRAHADAWEADHKLAGDYHNMANEYLVLVKRLEAAEKAWAEFKEHYPWTIQPWDDMQMEPEAVGALERLAAALAAKEKKT